MTTPETWLRIGAETSELVQKAPVVLRIGTRKIADQHLRHEPARPRLRTRDAFQRLPSRAMGREKAATLLILRELMHHRGFATVEVREKDLE